MKQKFDPPKLASAWNGGLLITITEKLDRLSVSMTAGIGRFLHNELNHLSCRFLHVDTATGHIFNEH